MPKRLYLDDAAATAVDGAVFVAMKPWFNRGYGNPASLHREGVAARTAVEQARRTVADCLEAHADEILFTSGGTESNNLALFGAAALQSDKRHLVISSVEHPSVSEAAAELERRGFSVTRLPVNPDGLIEVAAFRAALRSDTFLASVIFAQNEIGTIQSIAELGKICAKQGVLFHTDACQAAPWLLLRVAALHVDLLTLNAAKLHGPKGAGVLFRRRGVLLKPLLFGGGQEAGVRSGTENVPAIVGLATAFQRVHGRLPAVEKIQAIRDELITRLTALPGVRLNGHPRQRLPNNVNVSVEGVTGETLVLGLDGEGLAVSSGSACSSLHQVGSHALTAIGAPADWGNLRISLDQTITRRDVGRIIAAVSRVLDRQRPVQRIWDRAVTEAKERHARLA